MYHFLRRSSLLQRAIRVSAYPTLAEEYSVLKTCIPSTSRTYVLGSSVDIRHAAAPSPLRMFGSGMDVSSSFVRHFPATSSPHVMGTIVEVSSCIRHVHSTSSRKGAAPKLKEAPVDSLDDIDPLKPADYNPSNYDAAESRSAPSEKILQLVDEIANLTLIDASDLSYLLKKKLGLPDSAMPYYGGGVGANMGGAASGGASPSAEEEKKPEKTNFDVKLEKYDAAAKIKVIKEVRTFTSLGLKEAKELVEKLPAVLKKGVGKEEAEQMIEKLKAVGATAVLE